MVGDDGREWGEIYDNRTGIGVLGKVFEDKADLGISKILTLTFLSLFYFFYTLYDI